MNSLFEITTHNGQLYFDLLYFLAILFSGIFFILEGKRKNYPMLQWFLIFLSGLVFFIIGTKLAGYSTAQWNALFSNLELSSTGRKTVLGGILLGIFGVWTAKRMLNFPYSVLDAFAICVPIGMGIQRLGCFMAGCCSGTITSLPWSVSYSGNAMPYWKQLHLGQIHDSDLMSLPLHSSQIYETIFCLLVAFIVWRSRSFFKRSGSLLLFSVALYSLARFVVEFWRDGAFNMLMAQEGFGLKYVQWMVLAVALLLFTFIFLRERYSFEKPVQTTIPAHPIGVFIFIGLSMFLMRNIFTSSELFFIMMVFIPVIIMQVNYMLDTYTKGLHYQLVATFLLLFVFFFTGTLIAQKSYDEFTKSDSLGNSFTFIELGYGTSGYRHYHTLPTQVEVTPAQGCNDPVYNYYHGTEYEHTSEAYAAGITHINTYGEYDKLTLKANGMMGTDRSVNAEPAEVLKIWDANPAMKYDTRFFGGGIGFHVGKSVNEELKDNVQLGEYYFSQDDKGASYVAFSGSVRVLPYDIVYAELRYNELFPYQIGHRNKSAYQFVFGSGLSLKNGTFFEIGKDVNAGTFVSARALVKNKYALKGSFYNGGGDNGIQMMQVSASFRIGQKHWVRNIPSYRSN